MSKQTQKLTIQELELSKQQQVSTAQELVELKQQQPRASQVVSKQEFAQIYQELQELRQRVEAAEGNPDVGFEEFQRLEEQVEQMSDEVQLVVRRASVVDKKANFSAAEIVKLDKQLAVLTQDFYDIQAVDQLETSSPEEVKQVVELVQNSRELLEKHAQNLKDISDQHTTKTAQQQELLSVLKNDDDKKYYLDVLRMMNGLHAASLSIDSEWVRSKKTGVMGIAGSIVKLAGNLSPAFGGVFVAAGSLMVLLGSEIKAAEIKKLAQICPRPADIDAIAQGVTLKLLQLHRADSIKNGNIVKANDAAVDVANIMKAVFAGKINVDHAHSNSDLATAFVQAALGQEIGAPVARSQVPASHPTRTAVSKKPLQLATFQGFDYSKRGDQDIIPSNPYEKSLYEKVTNKFNGYDFGKSIFEGINVEKQDKQIRTKLLSVLIEALREGAILDRKFADCLTAIPEVMNNIEMANSLKAALREKVIVGNTIDSNTKFDKKIMRDVVKDFAVKLLDRQASKEKGGGREE